MRLVMAGIFLLMVSGVEGQTIKKHRFTDSAPAASSYPLTLKLASSEYDHHNGMNFLRLSGELEGQPLELESEPADGVLGLLPPGEYRVRLAGENRHKDGTSEREYDVLLSHGKHAYFMQTGVSAR